MTDPRNAHPLAPKPDSSEEGIGHTDNEPDSVRVRGGVELGAMRYVLVIGVIAAVIALFLAWLMGGLPF